MVVASGTNPYHASNFGGINANSNAITNQANKLPPNSMQNIINQGSSAPKPPPGAQAALNPNAAVPFNTQSPNANLQGAGAQAGGYPAASTASQGSNVNQFIHNLQSQLTSTGRQLGAQNPQTAAQLQTQMKEATEMINEIKNILSIMSQATNSVIRNI